MFSQFLTRILYLLEMTMMDLDDDELLLDDEELDDDEDELDDDDELLNKNMSWSY